MIWALLGNILKGVGQAAAKGATAIGHGVMKGATAIGHGAQGLGKGLMSGQGSSMSPLNFKGLAQNIGQNVGAGVRNVGMLSSLGQTQQSQTAGTDFQDITQPTVGNPAGPAPMTGGAPPLQSLTPQEIEYIRMMRGGGY